MSLEKATEFIHIGACFWEERVSFFALVSVEELECFTLFKLFQAEIRISYVFTQLFFFFFNELQRLFQILFWGFWEVFLFVCLFVWYFFVFPGSMWEFLGQGLNLHHTAATRATAVRMQEPQPARPSENSLLFTYLIWG